MKARPESAEATSSVSKFGATAINANEPPCRNQPTISEVRREYVSATTPVGISKRKAVTSITVPISTSWSGERPMSET